MRIVNTRVPAAALALLLAMSGAPSAGAEQRILSIGGAVTEIVFALGAGDRVIAVDSTSLHPPEAEALPDIGYMRQLVVEPVLAMEPTLVLAVEDAGPPEAIRQIEAAGLPFVRVPDRPSPDGVIEKLDIIAAALGLEREGDEIARRLRAEFETLAGDIGRVRDRPRVLFLLSVGRGAPLAAGRDTSAAGIIDLAGGVNVVDGFEGFKPLSPEAAVAAAPEVILANQRTVDLLGGPGAVLARPEVAVTPAGRNGRLVSMDGLLLLGFGPRTPQAIRELAGALHPDLTLSSVSGDQ